MQEEDTKVHEQQNSEEAETSSYKPKIKVFKRQLIRLCSLYTEQLTNEFGKRLLNPSTQLLIERRLQQIQYESYRREPQNTLWLVPVKVVFQLENNHSFDVTVSDPNAILIMDFDSRGY